MLTTWCLRCKNDAGRALSTYVCWLFMIDLLMCRPLTISTACSEWSAVNSWIRRTLVFEFPTCGGRPPTTRSFPLHTVNKRGPSMWRYSIAAAKRVPSMGRFGIEVAIGVWFWPQGLRISAGSSFSADLGKNEVRIASPWVIINYQIVTAWLRKQRKLCFPP